MKCGIIKKNYFVSQIWFYFSTYIPFESIQRVQRFSNFFSRPKSKSPEAFQNRRFSHDLLIRVKSFTGEPSLHVWKHIKIAGITEEPVQIRFRIILLVQLKMN